MDIFNKNVITFWVVFSLFKLKQIAIVYTICADLFYWNCNKNENTLFLKYRISVVNCTSIPFWTDFNFHFAVHSIQLFKQWIYCEHLAFSITHIDIQFTAHLPSIWKQFDKKATNKNIAMQCDEGYSLILLRIEQNNYFQRNNIIHRLKTYLLYFLSMCFVYFSFIFIFIFNLVQFVRASVWEGKFRQWFFNRFSEISSLSSIYIKEKQMKRW